jgi:hypothetical protein
MRLTSPCKGEVGSQSEPGGVRREHGMRGGPPPRPSPLQGEGDACRAMAAVVNVA